MRETKIKWGKRTEGRHLEEGGREALASSTKRKNGREERTRCSNSTTESTKAQAPRNARFLPLPLRIRQLDPLERAHIDSRVGEHANQPGGETAEEEAETASEPHVVCGLEDEGVAPEGGGTGGGHDAGLEVERELSVPLPKGRKGGKRETHLERLNRVDAELTNHSTNPTRDEPARVGDERLVGNAVPVLSKDALCRFVREELDRGFLCASPRDVSTHPARQKRADGEEGNGDEAPHRENLDDIQPIPRPKALNSPSLRINSLDSPRQTPRVRPRSFLRFCTGWRGRRRGGFCTGRGRGREVGGGGDEVDF